MTPTLRRPVVEDADAVASLHVRSWRAAYAGIVPQHVLDGLDVASRAEGLRERLRTGTSAAGYVACHDDVVVGFCWFGPHRDDEHRATVPGVGWGEVYAIYVDPDAWGGGTGRALMDAALADLAPAPVAVWVLTENHAARAFYERYGFRPDGATQVFAEGRLDIPETRYAFVR